MDNQTWQSAPSGDPNSSIFNAPPKMTFALGVMVGISAISLFGFIWSFSAYRNAVDGGTTKKTATTNTNTTATNTAVDTAPTGPIDVAVANDDWSDGKSDAKVTLVEFSDFECPYCSRFQPVIEQVMTDYKDQVRLVYKHYPLTSIHPNAQKAAEAAECAGDQDKFWEMHDKLFANQSSLSVTSYKAWAKELGLNEKKFATCIDNSEKANDVKSDQTYGDSIGVQGTPSTFVNGYLVSGAQSYDYVKNLIDQELAKT